MSWRDMKGRNRDGVMGGRAVESLEKKQKVMSGLVVGQAEGFGQG